MPHCFRSLVAQALLLAASTLVSTPGLALKKSVPMSRDAANTSVCATLQWRFH